MKKMIMQFLPILLFPLLLAQGQSNADIINLIERGQTEKARQTLSQINEDQIEPDLRLLLQGWLSTNGDSAIVCYEKLIQTYPNSQFSDDALFKLAQLKYAQGLYITAQEQFSQLMIDYPRSGLHQNCIYWTGLCYQATGKMDSAQIQFQKALREYPTTALSSIIQKDLTALEQEQIAERIKSAQTPSVTYAVQVGAFTHQNNAILRSQFFEDKGYQVNLRTKRQNGTTYYLVWIGSFDSDSEARAFGEELKRRWDVNYTLVSE